MDKKNIYIMIAVLVVGVLVVWTYVNRAQYIEVNNYEECEAAGYRIMESYPRQCVSPDGTTFTEEVDEIPVELNIESTD